MKREGETGEPSVPAGASAPSDLGGAGLQPQPNPEIERVVDRMAAHQEQLSEREWRGFTQWLSRLRPGWWLRSRR